MYPLFLILLYVALACCALIFVRLYFLIFMKRRGPREESSPVKTMIILGSGGHTAEMLRIVERLNLRNYSPRVYVHAQTDRLSLEKVRNLEVANKDYSTVDIYRSREVRQSYFTSVWTTALATLNSIPLLWRERPELILCNGPGTCVPLCVVAFLLKALFLSQTVIVFVESFCRVKTFSLTGRILYYLADYVIVHWTYLAKPAYSKSILL